MWLPVALGAGIAGYFALPLEPSPWHGLLLLVMSASMVLVARGRQGPLVLGMLALAAALGFAAAQVASSRAAAPVLGRELGPVTVAGRVVAVEQLERGTRVVLEDLNVERLAAPPARVRIRLTARSEIPSPGDRLTVPAVLRPPPAPAMPGAFDFSRHAWFERLGGVGYAVGHATIAREPAEGLLRSLELGLAGLRQRVTGRVVEAVGGPDGAVAAALITGERTAIPDDLWEAYRDSGLAHLLSISGLHMAMVAGLVFLVVRGALALMPPLALRHPIKKWTAVVALAATFFYLLLAGAPVPTQRAFLMIAISLLAILVDRAPVSMRLVAWAAAAVLLWQPQALVGASFQMSFAAVVALVAAYELLGGPLARWRTGGGPGRAALLYVAGIGLSTLIAGTATAVYAVHHFNRFAVWSLAANLAAVPLTGLWVMPAALLALLLMPLGLDGPALWVMGQGVAAVNRIAVAVAAWPGASVMVPAPSMAGLAVFTLGGLWLCLWRRRWRLLGLPAMAAGLATAIAVAPADILVDGDGDLVAVRGADGALMASTLRGGRFVRQVWEERLAEAAGARAFPPPGGGPDNGLSCDSLGCVLRHGPKAAALVMREEALAEDCALLPVVVALVPARRCAAPVVVDRFDLWRNGAHALWLEAGTARVLSVREWQGERPWTRRPESRRAGEDAAGR